MTTPIYDPDDPRGITTGELELDERQRARFLQLMREQAAVMLRLVDILTERLRRMRSAREASIEG